MSAYLAAFQLGVRQALRDKPELLSGVMTYAILLGIFWTIFSIMPVAELGVPGLEARHLFWYFVVTEAIIVGNPGMALFGAQIGEGRLGEFMQRPCSVMGFVVLWATGLHIVVTAMLIVGALLVVPLLFGVALPAPLYLLPLLALSLILGIMVMELMSFSLSTAEVLGPYAQPLSWIISKLIFAFGGLFFPVSFFPPVIRDLVMLTPFPSVIFIPGQFMLTQDVSVLLQGVAQQMFWLAVMMGVAHICQRRMLAHVLVMGD